jgi:predicted nuclease of predicted toxin-antitoxin system
VKPPILLDENVSLALVSRLRTLGYDVVAIAEQASRGRNDEGVFSSARQLGAVLVTRDAHFTNPVRFDPSLTAGIIHIVHGNLTASDEIALVEGFLGRTPVEACAGKLVLLARDRTIIR